LKRGKTVVNRIREIRVQSARCGLLLLLTAVGAGAAAAEDDLDALLLTTPEEETSVSPESAPPAPPEPPEPYAQSIPVKTVAPAIPEPKAPKRRGVIEEIVVTATRREQNIQDVVGGIQALSGADLESQGAAGFEDYLTQIPGTGFRQDGSGNTKIGMRGVSNVSGNQLGTFSGSSPVGVYINDVPIQGSGQLPNLDLYDLNRVEVLKGPQGTLYGEGAMGGAIRMIVNEPSLESADLKAELGSSYTEYGSFNESLKLAAGMPIVDGQAGIRLVGSFKRDSGFIDLPNQERRDANDTEAASVRLLTHWQASAGLSAQLLYLKDRGELHGSPNVNPELEKPYANDIYEHEMARSDIDLGGLTLKYDFDSVQLAAVTSLMQAKRHTIFRLGLWKDLITHNVEDRIGPLSGFADLLVSPIFLASNYREEPFDNHTNDDGFAQELRLVSSGDQRLSWVAGLYYQRRDQHYEQTSYIYESPTPGENRQLYRRGVQPMRQVSIYGEGTYPVLSSLELTLGLRAVRESIGINDYFQTFGVLAAAQAAAQDPNPKTLNVETTYDNYLPKVSLGWHVSDDQMVYALASRGYRSTTPNVQVNLGVGPPLLKADSLWNYELGAKTQWLDGALIANGSVYYIDWKNLQASRSGDGQLGPLPISVIYIDNIGDATIKGVEMELQLALGESFSVGLAGGYQDGRLSRLGPDSLAIPGSRIPNAPEWSGTFSLGYQRPASDTLLWNANASLQYVDEQGSSEVTAKNPTGSATAAYTRLGAQLGLQGDKWGVTLFGDNLLNEAIELQNASLVGTEHFTTLGRPRTYGLRVRADFGQ